jgi:hypothetical protein
MITGTCCCIDQARLLNTWDAFLQVEYSLINPESLRPDSPERRTMWLQQNSGLLLPLAPEKARVHAEEAETPETAEVLTGSLLKFTRILHEPSRAEEAARVAAVEAAATIAEEAPAVQELQGGDPGDEPKRQVGEQVSDGGAKHANSAMEGTTKEEVAVEETVPLALAKHPKQVPASGSPRAGGHKFGCAAVSGGVCTCGFLDPALGAVGVRGSIY